jgi:hypothetical protein
MKLMMALNIIENKLDKESSSSKSGSHMYPYEKTRERSVSRHHHHSPRHSNKRASITLKRKVLLGGNSRSILRRNT